MINNQKNKAGLVVISIISAFVVVLVVYKSRQCTKLECLSMKDLDKFKVQEVYQDNDNTYRTLLSRDNDILRVDIRTDISESESKSRIQTQITRIKAQFENATSPYPGEISDQIECSGEYKPVFFEERINGVQASYFTAFLNNRLVLGACTEDQAVYKEIFALFYCPKQRQFFQMELIAPKDVFDSDERRYKQMLYSIDCRSN